MVLPWTHGVTMESWCFRGLMVFLYTHGVPVKVSQYTFDEQIKFRQKLYIQSAINSICFLPLISFNCI